MNVEVAFQQWLDGKMGSGYKGETRREYAESLRMSLDDLRWGFTAGYNRGLLNGIKEGSK